MSNLTFLLPNVKISDILFLDNLNQIKITEKTIYIFLIRNSVNLQLPDILSNSESVSYEILILLLINAAHKELY